MKSELLPQIPEKVRVAIAAVIFVAGVGTGAHYLAENQTKSFVQGLAESRNVPTDVYIPPVSNLNLK